MTYRRIILMLIVTLAVISGSYIVASVYQTPSSPPTASVSVGLDDQPTAPGMKTTDEMISFWRNRFERDPRDFISLTFLGGSFIRKGRETGDVGEYERAEATLRKALQIDPDYEGAQAYLSTVQYVKHDFQNALDLASRVYAAHPNAIEALATIGDAQLELGNYAQAQAAYQQLLDKNPGPSVYSRLARQAWLRGRPDEALNQMRQAVDEALAVNRTGENAAWYQFQLAELYFNSGRLEEADKYYASALDSFNNYYLALAGLGKLRAAEGRDEAIGFYQRAVAIVPQPDFLAALGDIYARGGQHDKARQQYDTVEYIGKLAKINRQIYNRQLANFYSDHDMHLDEALQLATSELDHRKDVFGFDAAAWAYYKNGKFSQAQQAMDQAMKLGTRDTKLYYHAGMIAYAQGRAADARRFLSEALAMNPHFDLLQAPIAWTTLEQLGVN